MATNNIQFKIFADYAGEGFKKAKEDINVVNQNVKKGAEAVTQLQGALGQMDSEAAKALGAMTNLANAILSFNVTAIATQAAIFTINRYFGDMKDAAEEAKKKVDELHASMEKSFGSALSSRIMSVGTEIKNLTDDFEQITKQANQFAAALEGVRSAEANGGLIDLQVEKLNKLLESHSEAEREAIEATYNLKIAVQKSADTAAEWEVKIDAAHQAVVDNENRMAVVDKQIAAVYEERKNLEQTMLSAKSSGDKHYLEIQKQVNALKEKELELEKKRQAVETQMDTLRVEEKKVKQEAVNAQKKATIEIQNAELAEKKLTEAKAARKVKEETANEAATLKAAEDKKYTSQLKTASEIQNDLNAASRALKQAEEDYARMLNAYNSSDLVTNALRDYVKDKGKGGLLPVDIQKGIQMTVADQKVDDAIRNGTITTVKDADREQRNAMRQARDAISKNQTQQLNEAKKYERLKGLNPKTLNSADKDFMAKYEKIIKAAEERKRALEDAKKEMEKRREDLKDIKENLKSIKEKMKDLGLK